ncbi:MAG: hypothetical protein IKN25_02920 [Spirochaetales bacterium]|nr:hypothetical protein [Spirochaetales bacterium]
MAVEKQLTEDQEDYAVAALMSMAAQQLSAELQIPQTDMLSALMKSRVGQLLFDETSKLWCRGPNDIVRLYKEENNIK